MLLNSLPFLGFFLIVTIVWFTVPLRWRSVVLLGASVWFYVSWSPLFLWVLAVCIVAAWGGGVLFGVPRGPKRVFCFVASLSLPAGLLLVFKYYNFFARAVTQISGRFEGTFTVPVLNLILPAGISFFVFKTMSYLIDVYTGKIAPEKSILNVANYIAFFPQILAGPIERAGNFLPQLSVAHVPDPERFRDGLTVLLWGLFKKMVVADNCATVVNWVYAAPSEYPGLALIIATYCYAVQIYCDFSGYSDMAIGIARILGFTTMQNFNRPYGAVSVGEFWKRWHISLSRWFRDYLYIPLGGNRVAYARWILNVMIVFVVSGLWHGANWTFIVWGGLHGCYLVGERVLSRPFSVAVKAFGLVKYSRLLTALRSVVTFHLVTFAWIFFRARTVTDAFHIVGHLFDNMSLTALNLFRQQDLVVAAAGCAALVVARLVTAGRGSGRALLYRWPQWVRWAVYAAMIVAIINMRPLFQSGFIYLQF